METFRIGAVTGDPENLADGAAFTAAKRRDDS
jgi:hypothetical protein